jgi:hypothetical protein
LGTDLGWDTGGLAVMVFKTFQLFIVDREPRPYMIATLIYSEFEYQSIICTKT